MGKLKISVLRFVRRRLYRHLTIHFSLARLRYYGVVLRLEWYVPYSLSYSEFK